MNRMQFDSLLTTIIITRTHADKHTRIFGVGDVGGVAGGGGGVGKMIWSWSFTVTEGKKKPTEAAIFNSFFWRVPSSTATASL